MRLTASLASAHPSALKVGMLVGSFSPAGGGVGEAVRSLSLALMRRPGLSVEVFCLGDGRGDGFATPPAHFVPSVGPSVFGYAPTLVPALRAAALDVLHVHGLWMYLSVAARRWNRESARPYLVSPHGMLDPWALRNGGAKKWLARRLYEDAHLRGASCLHALCASEEESIRLAGYSNPVATIPNGVDMPWSVVGNAPWRAAMPADAKVLLFLGRVTPKKRVLELVRAFGRVASSGTPWHLVVVGPAASDYRAAIETAIDATPGRDRIHVVGPAYGKARACAYASADAFVLPSMSEGLPMAALEAFAYGLPGLLTPQCNLPEAFAAGCALPTGTDEKTIEAGLLNLFAMPAVKRRIMGQNARRLVIERFTWDMVAGRMEGLYRSLASAGAVSVESRRSRTTRAGLPT